MSVCTVTIQEHRLPFTLQIQFNAISSLDKIHTEQFHNGSELLTRGPLNGVHTHTTHKQHWKACMINAPMI